MNVLRLAGTAAVALLTGCASVGDPAAGPSPGPTVSPSPIPSPPPEGEVNSAIRFVLEEEYRVGETVDVRIENLDDVAYIFNPYYEACDLTYLDSSGREFIIPPGTHCDLVVDEEILPGQTKKLFRWKLEECVKDEWGCVKSEPLPPGTYAIKGSFRAMGGGPRARAEATFAIAEG